MPNLDANLAAILTLITAITAAIVTIINALKNDKKFKQADNKLDSQTNKLEEIHRQTNGTLSNCREKIAALEAENAKLDAINRRLTHERRRDSKVTRQRIRT